MNKKLSVISAVVIEIIFIFYVIKSIIENNMKNLHLSILGFVSVIIPFIISHLASRKKLHLPTSFKLVFVWFLFATQFLGEVNTFYTKYWWWDLVMHGFFGSYAVIVATHLIKYINKKDNEVTANRFVLFKSFFAFAFALALGTLWEIFEFSGDFIFNTGMIKGGLEDTMTDLIAKAAFALATSAYYYIKNKV